MGFAILYLTLPISLGYYLYWFLYRYLPNMRYRKLSLSILRTSPLAEGNVYDGVRKLKREYNYLVYRNDNNASLTFKDILEGNYHNAEHSMDRMSRHQAFHVKLFIESYRPTNYITKELYWPIRDVESRKKFLDMLEDKAYDFYYER